MTQSTLRVIRFPARLAVAAILSACALPACAQGPEASTTATSAAIASFVVAQQEARAERDLTLAAFDNPDAAPPAGLNLQMPDEGLKPATPPPVRPRAEWFATNDGFQIYNFKARYKAHF